ncbi:MAG TPA: hypothetical protein VIP05_11220 [Burkholderiaceae bacterium]
MPMPALVDAFAPLRARALLAALAVAPACACAGGYVVHVRPGDDGQETLAIERDGRHLQAPRTEPGQEGFEQVRVSPDGRTVGWVARMPNCCTSYPVPLVLVLFRDGRVIRRFDEAPPIWHWAFSHDGREVVTQQAVTHGPEYFHFARRRISDGRTLAEFDCNQDEPVHAPRPAWSRVVDVDCPDYVPPPAEDAASAP